MDKKSVMITVLAVLLAAVLAGGGVYIWQQDDDEDTESSMQEDVTNADDEADADEDASAVTTEDDDAEPAVDDETLITEALATKLGSDPVDLLVSFDENDGTHANGTVGFVDQIGGGWWLAVKDGNDWTIVADGNGVVMCDDIAPYDFPTSMVPECWDGTQTVIR